MVKFANKFIVSGPKSHIFPCWRKIKKKPGQIPKMLFEIVVGKLSCVRWCSKWCWNFEFIIFGLIFCFVLHWIRDIRPKWICSNETIILNTMKFCVILLENRIYAVVLFSSRLFDVWLSANRLYRRFSFVFLCLAIFLCLRRCLLLFSVKMWMWSFFLSMLQLNDDAFVLSISCQLWNIFVFVGYSQSKFIVI